MKILKCFFDFPHIILCTCVKAWLPLPKLHSLISSRSLSHLVTAFTALGKQNKHNREWLKRSWEESEMVQARDWWPTACGHVVCHAHVWVSVSMYRSRWQMAAERIKRQKQRVSWEKYYASDIGSRAEWSRARYIFAAHWVWIKRCRLSANPCWMCLYVGVNLMHPACSPSSAGCRWQPSERMNMNAGWDTLERYEAFAFHILHFAFQHFYGSQTAMPSYWWEEVNTDMLF